ncbi:MAG: class I SAM-dependent methyltransferase [Solirubrobacterales bacterium]
MRFEDILTSEYDDSIWRLVPDEPRPPDPWLAARAREFAAGAGSVLDLGCGDGVYLPELAQPGVQLHAADRSAVALERAARRQPGAELHTVDADERFALDDNSVSAIWCCDTLEHVVDTQTFLSEARRVLLPGGRLLVITPDHPLRLRLRLAFAGWNDHFDPLSPHLRFFTARSLTTALVDCGFEQPNLMRRRGVLVAEALRL